MVTEVRHRPELLLKAQAVSVVFFDVDGVLTSGALYFSARGEAWKQFNTLDGVGLKLLRRAGIVPAIITGRDSKPLRLRLRELGVDHAHFGVEDKCAAAQSILNALALGWDQAAAMGDDWADIALMRRCALAGAPPNAHDEVLAIADYVSSKQGGNGAVREFCDLLLIASGNYARLLEDPGS